MADTFDREKVESALREEYKKSYPDINPDETIGISRINLAISLHNAYISGWKEAMAKLQKTLKPSFESVDKLLDELHKTHERLGETLANPPFIISPISSITLLWRKVKRALYKNDQSPKS